MLKRIFLLISIIMMFTAGFFTVRHVFFRDNLHIEAEEDERNTVRLHFFGFKTGRGQFEILEELIKDFEKEFFVPIKEILNKNIEFRIFD